MKSSEFGRIGVGLEAIFVARSPLIEAEKTYKRLKRDDLNYEGCMNLIVAFVAYIREDYEACAAYERRCPNDKRNLEHLEELRKTILSEQFGRITNLDGSSILREFERIYRRKR